MSEAAAQRVLVIQDASRDTSFTALKWAINDLSLKPGDELTLLRILRHVRNPMGYKNRIDSSSIVGANWKAVNQEVQKKEEEHQNNTEMLQISKLFEMREIAFHKKVVAATSAEGVAVEAAKDLKATWVILDRKMKKNKKYFMAELSCGILMVKGKNTVEILRGPKTTSGNPTHMEGCQSCQVKHDELLPGPEIEARNLEMLQESQSSLGSNLNDELGICIGGLTDASIGTISSSTIPLSENLSLLDIALNIDQTTPTHLSGSEHSSLVEGDNSISTKSATPDDDSPITISNLFEVQHTECHGIPNHETLQEHSKITEEIITYGSTNRHLEDKLEYPACLNCGNERPKSEAKREFQFTYAELYTATNGFSAKNFLSEGGFGSVYKGILEDGQQIAVKQYKQASMQGEKEFRSEVQVLSEARHENVVMLLGSCSEGNHRLIVYEYICNGSLDMHLSKYNTNVLRWEYRMKIALGIARGLNYLHQNNIIHRDMRPNNVLITHDYEPLLGDFGLARSRQTESEHVPEKVVGTIGYLAPEYAERGRASSKTDVYSFGVVLLELITGRATMDKTLQGKGLVGWARPLLKEKKYPELIDERILDCHDVHQLFWMVHVAEVCLRKDPDRRPSMEQVQHVLKIITDGDIVTDVEELSPTWPSDSSSTNSNEPQAEQGKDSRESTSESSASFSEVRMREAFLAESSASFKFSCLNKGKSSLGKMAVEKLRGQRVLYDEMLD